MRARGRRGGRRLAVVCGVLLAGCALRLPPPAGPPPERVVFAYSLRGHPLDVYVCGAGPGGILVVGGTHGDERGGARLVGALAKRLRCPDELAVIIVPALNPDGLDAGTRGNAHGVDLNRNLPARSWTPRPAYGWRPLSEPESQALDDLLRRVRPVLTVSVHEGDVPLVDWDGPAYAPARVLAACTGLPLRRLRPRPGSLGSLLGVDWGWPLVTLELPRAASRSSAETLWEHHGDCLLAVIAGRW